MYRCDKCGIQSVAAAICTSCGDDLKRVGPARVSYVLIITAADSDVPSRILGPFDEVRAAVQWWDDYYDKLSPEHRDIIYHIDILERP